MRFEDFEIVVGLEIHVRLNTLTKAFCGDLNLYGGSPNTHLSSIVLAHPGTLPKVNKEQLKKAIKLGLALGSRINQFTFFDRKHYFYPDLPKGYQLTQDNSPVCIGGKVILDEEDISKEVRIHHIHMEEDAGKLIHVEDGDYSLVDHNRAGSPLLEIVTEPDLRSGKEVATFMKKMIHLLDWLSISDVNLEDGSFRCDCNVSIRPKGQEALGERCEIKNLNSMKFARQAVKSEARRQFDLLSKGISIQKTTMSFNTKTGKTFPTRSKESAHDYRYFPDPDLCPIFISNELIEEIQDSIHPLPEESLAILKNKHGLSDYDADLIIRSREVTEYFMQMAERSSHHTLLSNTLINKIIPHLEEKEISISEFHVGQNQVLEFVNAISNGDVSLSSAFQKLFSALMKNSDKAVQQIIDQEGLRLTKDASALSDTISKILDDHPVEIAKYRKGKKALFGFFMGAVMKSSGGNFDPKEIKTELQKLLNS